VIEKLDLFRKQKFSYWNSNKRLNIWEGSVRAGKTIASIWRWIKYIGNAPKGDLVMTGKTNGSLYRNIIRPMYELLGDDMHYASKHDSRVVELWGREIFCFGANDESAEGKIRGLTVAGGYGDEITLWPASYFKMHLSRMSVANAKFFGSTNPDNPNHWLKQEYLNRAGELDLRSFHFDIRDNRFLPPEFVAALMKEYVGLWFRRFIKGEWCVAEGAIYDFFEESMHCGYRHPKAKWHVVSIDYATGNPTSYGLYGINPNTRPKIWRERGYFWDSKKEGRQKTDTDYSNDMQTFLNWNGKGEGEKIVPRKIYVDPSAGSFKLQLKKDGFHFVTDANNDVLDGIRTQAKMLQNGEYMIIRHKSNQPCIDEYYGYVWDDKATKRGEDKPLKTSDHTKDEERYVLHSEFGEEHLDYSILTRM
jgi:PBSX family phage terminase large subunit